MIYDLRFTIYGLRFTIFFKGSYYLLILDRLMFEITKSQEMDKKIFQEKTMNLAVRILRMVESMPQTNVANVLGKQIIRSSTSVGANYRAACRAKSPRDFINNLKIVEEEADETLFWLEMIEKSGIITIGKLDNLKLETNQVVSMVVSSLKTLKTQKKRDEIVNRKP